MKGTLKKIIDYVANNKLVNAFDNNNDGLSYRKLVSTAIVVMIWLIHKHFANVSNCVDFLKIDYIAIAVLLGLVSLDKIMANKNISSSTSDVSVDGSAKTETTIITESNPKPDEQQPG